MTADRPGKGAAPANPRCDGAHTANRTPRIRQLVRRWRSPRRHASATSSSHPISTRHCHAIVAPRIDTSMLIACPLGRGDGDVRAERGEHGGDGRAGGPKPGAIRAFRPPTSPLSCRDASRSKDPCDIAELQGTRQSVRNDRAVDDPVVLRPHGGEVETRRRGSSRIPNDHDVGPAASLRTTTGHWDRRRRCASRK
jgi:hypothetical protein